MPNLNIPDQFLVTLFQGLGELPLKVSGPVYSLIQQQAADKNLQTDSQVPMASDIWEHAARNLLQPDEFARLQEFVEASRTG